jgi:hypothetical protein
MGLLVMNRVARCEASNGSPGRALFYISEDRTSSMSDLTIAKDSPARRGDSAAVVGH